MKLITSVCLGSALLFTSIQWTKADEASIKQQITEIDKQWAPIRRKALADPEVKAAQEKLNAAMEAAIAKADPKGKELLDQRKKLVEELAAERKAAAAARSAGKHAPAPAPAAPAK